MSPERFISRRLKFQGNIAAASIAVSFLVIILAVSISSGFRAEIREGVAAMTGDIRIGSVLSGRGTEDDPLPSRLPSEEALLALPGVRSIAPVVVRAGIVRSGEVIHGVMVKGVTGLSDSTLFVSVPRRLADIAGLAPGDEMTTYFIGEKVRVRKFRVGRIHEDLLQMDDNLVVLARIEDMRRLNGWGEEDASALEVSMLPSFRTPGQMEHTASLMSARFLGGGHPEEEDLSATSAVRMYPQLFDWLDLLDFNVLVLLVLMIVVAAFNMISGLLIMLLRNIPAIGTLKTLGMTDRSIGGVFLRVAARVVVKGMLWGNALALLFCLVQGSTHLIPLDPVNYFVSYVPVHVDWAWILSADAVAFGAIMLLLLIPTLFIARVDPAETVKAQ